MFFRGFEVQDRRCQEGDGGEDAEVVADAHFDQIAAEDAANQIAGLFRPAHFKEGEHGGGAADAQHGGFVFQLPNHHGGDGDGDEQDAVAPLGGTFGDAGGDAHKVEAEGQAVHAYADIGHEGA